MLRDLGIALSLANLCFFRVWAKVLPGSPLHYNLKAPPSSNALVAVVLNVLLLALVFWIAARASRRSPRAFSAARWAFLAASLVALLNVARELPRALFGMHSPGLHVIDLKGVKLELPTFTLAKVSGLFDHMGMVLLVVGLGIVLAVAIVRWRYRLTRVVAGTLLILLPLVAVTFSRAAWAWFTYSSTVTDFADRAPAGPVDGASANTPRVLWMVFDELDERLAFVQRPANVDLPEMDRFRSEALYASNAFPPGGQTLNSMPALLTGRLVANAQAFRASELMLTFDGAIQPVAWSTQPTVFSEARELGLNGALMGMYHPYCRIIAGSLTTCSWVEWEHELAAETLGGNLLSQIVAVIDTVPGAKRIGVVRALRRSIGLNDSTKQRTFSRDEYLRTLDEGLRLAADPTFGLVLLHWRVPHNPFIYDRFKSEFAVKGRSSYFDNLELADRTLGEVRRAMVRAGTWDTTSVLISADHGYRTSMWEPKLPRDDETLAVTGGIMDPRVPFMLKLAGEHRGATYDAPFNTVLTHDLILALLRGEISGLESLVHWLDQHRSIGLSPYMDPE